MTRYTIRVVGPAREQAAEVTRWWRAHRDKAPDLFEQEFSRALDRLAEDPEALPFYAKRRGRVVRRIRLHKTRYALYFTVRGGFVDVLAVWHTARGSGPPLR